MTAPKVALNIRIRGWLNLSITTVSRIEPLGHRWANYEIDADALTGKGRYTATVELMAQMIPINLIITIQVVGFDYGMSPRAVADAVVAGREVLVEKTITFNVAQ